MYASPYKAKFSFVSHTAFALCAGLLLSQTANAQAPSNEPNDTPAPGIMTQPPKLVKFIEAIVPTPNGTKHILTERQVIRVELTVQADGTVADVSIASGADTTLNSAAIEAVRQFVFQPAEIDGRPGAVRIAYEYVFEASQPNRHPSVQAPSPAPPPAIPTGSLRGQLLEKGTRKPVLGATIWVEALGIQILTDAEGRFTLNDLPVGTLTLQLSDEEHATINDTEEIAKDSLTEIVYYAAKTGFGTDDLVATGRRVQKQVVRRILTVRQLETVPGSNGDAIKAVQNLPGIARTTGDQVVMRGINGGQILVNGHPITTAFHFGGLRSTVANGMIESLSVTPGNYSARFGGTNAGIVDIQTRRPKTDGLHGYGQVDIFDASVFVEGAAGENGAFAIGGRRSYIDGILNQVLDDEAKETFQTAPRYYDLQGTYDWKKGRNRLRFNVLGSSDRLVLVLTDLDESDPAARGELNFSTRWGTAQTLWDYRVSNKTQLSVGLSYLWADFDQSLGDLRLKFLQQSVTLRTDLAQEITPWLSLRTGINARAVSTEFDVIATPPPADGQPDSNLSLQEFIQTKGVARTYTPSAYAAADITFGALQIVPAIRLEHFSSVNQLNGSTFAQPRLSLRFAATDTTTFKAGAGLYSAPPEIEQSNREFGNPDIAPSQSRHYSAGVEQRLGEFVSVDATGYYQDLYNRISTVSDPTVRYDNHGAGRVYGGEFLLKYDDSARFYGWLAYTVSRSTRRLSGEAKERIFDFDQTHNLNVVGQYRLTQTWEIGGRFRYVTGNPTTPVVGATFDSDADTYAPTYGVINSDRVGAFHQLDIRVDKHWIYDTWKLTTYLDVQNVYNRANPEGVNYNFNFRQSKAAAGLPLIPSFGIKGEF